MNPYRIKDHFLCGESFCDCGRQPHLSLPKVHQLRHIPNLNTHVAPRRRAKVRVANRGPRYGREFGQYPHAAVAHLISQLAQVRGVGLRGFPCWCVSKHPTKRGVNLVVRKISVHGRLSHQITSNVVVSTPSTSSVTTISAPSTSSVTGRTGPAGMFSL